MSAGATRRLIIGVLGIGMLMLTACSSVMLRSQLTEPALPGQLSDNEQIAGEILAYMLEVVLGQAGPLEKRQAWATRGLGLPLDFDLVYRRMFGPVPLRAELMVLDTNILGLSQVLYYYDRRMNLFKGSRDHDSLFPCAELMAIRLLLLQKLHRHEKMAIAALIRHADLFGPNSREVRPGELAAMQIDAEEFAFLKSIFQSEPAFLSYLRHPFVVSTLKKIGLVEVDAATRAAERAATYRRLINTSRTDQRSRSLTIAILAGMMPMFEQTAATGDLRPSTEYVALRAAVQAAIRRKFDQSDGSTPDSRLSFYTPNRPLTIHPANADQVVGQICPSADFTVILLGKNVYRALFIDPLVDTYPHKKMLYLDIDDVRYDQIDQEIETIVSALMPFVAG